MAAYVNALTTILEDPTGCQVIVEQMQANHSADVQEDGCRKLALLFRGNGILSVTCIDTVQRKPAGRTPHNAFVMRLVLPNGSVFQGCLRYSDVRSLRRCWRADSNLLFADRRASALPPFPPRQPLRKQTPSFLRERGAALAAFLQASLAQPDLLAHPETQLLLSSVTATMPDGLEKLRLTPTVESDTSSQSSSEGDCCAVVDGQECVVAQKGEAFDPDDTPQQQAANAGAIATIVGAMRVHPQVAGVQAAGCEALACLCNGIGAASLSRRRQAEKAGAVEVILHAIDTHPKARGVQNAGIAALREISVVIPFALSDFNDVCDRLSLNNA